jgi:GAF domain-containing protein/multidrug resistance efflux pump
MADESENLRQELNEAFRQLEQTASRLLLINQAGMLTTSSHDTRLIARELLTSILDSVFAARGVVISYSEGGEVFDTLASEGLSEEAGRAFEESEAEATALWISSLQKGPVTRADVVGSENWEQGLPEPAFAVYVPLIIEDELIGALAAGDKTTGAAFDREELSFLSNLAHHAAVALNHSRLYAQLQRRLRDLDTLLKISQEITSTLDMDRIMRVMVTYASALADLHHCALGIRKAGRLDIDAVGGEQPGKDEKEQIRRLMEYVALAETEVSATAGELPEGEGRDLFRAYFESSGTGSFWGLPLKDDQGVLGTFCLIRAEKLPTSEEQELLRIMSNQASVAIRNAELYNQVPFIGFLEPILERRKKLWALGRNRWQRITITVAVAVALSLLIRLPHRAGGSALVLPGAQLNLRSPSNGVIEEVWAVEGDTVQAGQAVARVHSIENEIRYREVEGELAKARRDEASLRSQGDMIAAQLVASDRNMLEAELMLLQRERNAATLTAPFAGVVLTPHLEERLGEHIRSGEVFCEIGSLDRLRIELSLPEKNWHELEIGQPMKLKFYTYAERTFQEEVARLAPAATRDEKDRPQFVATTFMDDPPAGLRPQMTGVGRVNLGNRTLLWHIVKPFRRFIARRWWR